MMMRRVVPFSSSSRLFNILNSRFHNNSYLRGFSSSDQNDTDTNTITKDKKQQPTTITNSKKLIDDLTDATARGVGQVIFLNDKKCGIIIGTALGVADPYLFGLAILGTATATMTAHAAGLDRNSLKDGLLGYNGCLVGCAAAVFGSPSIIAATTATIIGAAATPFVAVSLKETMGSVPQWTFAFNIVALTSLLRTRPLLVAPSSPDIVDEGIMTGAVVESSTTVSASSSSFITDIITSPLTGISQIFVVQSTLSGAIIVGGIGSYSPLLAVHAVGGSAIGTLVGATSGAPLADLTMGLYGFNSALTSMAVGVFFVHSTPAMLLSAGGAAATASLFGAMSTVVGAYGSPCLTLPFCLTMSSCYLLHRQVPGLLLASNPHSPEKNKVD